MKRPVSSALSEKGDGMHQKVDTPPSFGQGFEQPVERGIVHHIGVLHDRRADAFGQRTHPTLEHLALIGEGKLGTRRRHRPAMPQAIDRSFATPMISPRRPFRTPLMPRPYPSYLLKISVALVPPKPKLFDNTVSSVASRVSVRISPGRISGSSVVTLAEPAMNPSRIISRQ